MKGRVLIVAGSDSGGGAGIQADIKTVTALGAYAATAITALTAQNTQGVSGVHIPPADFVAQQIDAIFADIDVAAVKIGMLGSPDVVQAVAEALKRHHAKNIVLDPVLVATSGDSLGAPGVVEAMREYLLPLARLIALSFGEDTVSFAAYGELFSQWNYAGILLRTFWISAAVVLVTHDPALAARSAYVGGPGLGEFLFSGLAQLGSFNSMNQTLVGAFGITILALIFDALFVLIKRVTTPRGLRV